MRLALMFLDRGEGKDHFAYSHASVLSRVTELTCYLSAKNTLLPKFQILPCEIKTFDWARGQSQLIRSILSGKDPTGVSGEINRDAPEIVLDTHGSWWSGVVERRLDSRIRVAEVVHDATPHPGLRGVVETLYRRLYPSVADVVVALSGYTHQELIRQYPRKAHIASRHGIFLPESSIDTVATASRRHRMFFFGRIDGYKGIEFLVEAYGIAKESNPNLELDIIGSGPLAPKVKERIGELHIGLTNRYVSDTEVKQAIAEHGVMILPYTSATQSGVAAIALGNGIPCIATRVGALPEQVVHDQNGIIVPPRDARALAEAMLRIAESEDLARSMADAAVRIGREDYSWETISRRLLSDLQAYLASVESAR